MGALAFFPLTGLAAGALIAHLTPHEIKDGAIYIKLLQHLLLATIVTVLSWPYLSYLSTLLGICTLIISWKLSIKHTTLVPVAALLALQPTMRFPVFLYFIPAGTLHRARELVIAASISTALLTIFLIRQVA